MTDCYLGHPAAVVVDLLTAEPQDGCLHGGVGLLFKGSEGGFGGPGIRDQPAHPRSGVAPPPGGDGPRGGGHKKIGVKKRVKRSQCGVLEEHQRPPLEPAPWPQLPAVDENQSERDPPAVNRNTHEAVMSVVCSQ